jgi:hypothetical protein
LRIPWDDTDYVDYSDYADDGDDTSAGSNMEAGHRNETASAQLTKKDMATLQRESYQSEPPVINVINRNQRNQMPASRPSVEIQGILPCEADTTPRAEQNNASLQAKSRKRCPHHPHEHRVRFDPAGQAWCDRMDCWDCYRLMKIGEALGYCCLIDRGGQRLIEQGMEAWSAFVLSQRPFPVMSATQEAIAMCKTQGIEVPDLSGEVQHLVEVRPTPS